jgi:hypothetical protein
MARFFVEAMYEYRGEVEARTVEEAESLFLDELNAYYMGTESFEIEELEEEEED